MQAPAGKLLRVIVGILAVVGMSPGYSQDAVELPDFADSAGAIISPEQERKLGEAFMRELRRHAPLVTDEEVEDYITKLGMSLGKQSDYDGDFHFVVLESQVINAFAVPGGFVGVHTGLILNSRDESELASVLAHEISHLSQRHGARMIEASSQMSIPSIAAMMGAIVLAAINPQAGMAALMGVQAAAQQYQINFTRANEKEADRIGIELLHDAGFDTIAMARFFERMQVANRYTDPKYIPEYLRSHPVTVNRIAEAKRRAEHLQQPVARENSYDYYLIWTKLNIMAAADPAQAKQQYKTALTDGTYAHESIARYGYALALTEAGDYDKARIEIAKLLSELPNVLAFRLAAARVDQESGDYAGAAANYKMAMDQDAESRAAVYGYANSLILGGHPEQAKRTLRDYGLSDRRDPRFFRLLAEAEQKMGDEANSHYSLAGYYSSIGELELAKESLKLAEAVPNITNYQRYRVQARIEEVEKELDAENKDRKKSGREEERR